MDPLIKSHIKGFVSEIKNRVPHLLHVEARESNIGAGKNSLLGTAVPGSGGLVQKLSYFRPTAISSLITGSASRNSSSTVAPTASK